MSQSTAEIRQQIDQALETGHKLSIIYIDQLQLIVSPLSVSDGMLNTWADSMNKARQFRLEFIKEALVVSQTIDEEFRG